MPGMVVSFRKKEGDRVKAGETVVILEAMKMENALVAPVSGVILSLSVRSGDSVAKDAVLCRIG
jgi:oxaloacetate decarboxylase alpha subunit/pyruvate carboxylase subunit B